MVNLGTATERRSIRTPEHPETAISTGRRGVRPGTEASVFYNFLQSFATA